MDFIKELDIYLRSRFTLISVQSYEEERVLERIGHLCEKTGRQCYVWDHADFFQALTDNCTLNPRAKDPLTALESIDKAGNEGFLSCAIFTNAWGRM